MLHWAIAAAILSNLIIGWWMKDAIHEAAAQARASAAFQLHNSIGLTVLLLTALRLLWRFTHKPPALPAGMARWERFSAKAAHWAFYILMVVVPLSGWTYVSSQWADGKPLNVPTLWFGLFQVPHLFDARAMTDAARAAVSERNVAAHYYLAWSLAGLRACGAGLCAVARVSADGAIQGTLWIKDRALPVTGLKATLDKGVLHITGKFDIARKDADLGQESDSGGDYVSLKIGVAVNVIAKAPQ